MGEGRADGFEAASEGGAERLCAASVGGGNADAPRGEAEISAGMTTLSARRGDN